MEEEIQLLEKIINTPSLLKQFEGVKEIKVLTISEIAYDEESFVIYISIIHENSSYVTPSQSAKIREYVSQISEVVGIGKDNLVISKTYF